MASFLGVGPLPAKKILDPPLIGLAVTDLKSLWIEFFETIDGDTMNSNISIRPLEGDMNSVLSFPKPIQNQS
jgi:hypothetical protein